jgi:hypothetical protein
MCVEIAVHVLLSVSIRSEDYYNYSGETVVKISGIVKIIYLSLRLTQEPDFQSKTATLVRFCSFYTFSSLIKDHQPISDFQMTLPVSDTDMNFPERVFAIGGAGKAIAFELLESEWVLKDLLQPRPNPSSLTVTIIDTAEGEENTDKQRVQEIRRRINEKEEELRNSEEGRTGNVDVEYKLITEDIHLSGSIDLLGEEAVPRIAAGNGMDEENWWIQEQHINENLDFAKGVVRKRGLGKAIYYKAYAEDDQISSYIDLPQKGKVAILAGLGGGTGSGILLDLANHLQEKQRTAEITLFGILPNHTEGMKENTNAFAALSELEYNALKGEQVFKDRILMPIDPTNFDGKTGNRIQTGKLLQELDEAVLYLLSAYYNTEGLEDPFADTPQYAPFTIGIPQVLRYNVEAINEARDQFREVLNEKEEALQIEDEVYSKLDRFLTKHYDPERSGQETGLRDLDKTDLQERLEDAEAWLDFDLFNELEYQSIEVFEDIVSDGKDESEDIIEQIDIISGSLRAVDTTSQETGTYVDNIDEHLAEVLEQDLTLIARRKELLERRKAIDDNQVRDAVEYLMGIGDAASAPGVKLQRLEAKLEDVEERRDDVQNKLEETKAELEAKRDEQSAEIERQTSEWVRDVEDHVNQLRAINVGSVQSKLTALDSHLDQFVRSVVNAVTADEVERAPEGEVLQTIDEVTAELNAAGVDVSNQMRAISGSLTELKRAKTAFQMMHQEESTLESITPWKSDTEEQREDANRDYRIQKNNLNEKGVFQIGPPTGNFDVSITYDSESIIERCRQERRQRKDAVIQALQARVENLPSDVQQSLDTQLDADQPDLDSLRETARQAIRLDIGETDDIEQRKTELEAELADIEQQRDMYQPAIELFQDVNNRRETWSSKSKSFKQQLSEHEGESDRRVATQEDDYVYVKSIKPQDIFRATGRDNIAESDLFSSDDENRRVRSNLEELAKNARNQQYTGLYRRKIAKGHSRYSDLKVRVAATSPAIDQIDPEALDFEDMFRGAFDLGASGKRVESPFTSWRQDIGGAWDVGLSVFITGVFLDNIRKVVQADGYHAGYKQRAGEMKDDILVHHSYGLDQGYYVRRKGLLNMEDDDDIEFYLRDEKSVVDDLLEEYIETVDVE